jgi:MoxR-like ATPase
MTAKTASSTKKTTRSSRTSGDQLSKGDVAAIDQLREVNEQVRTELARIIIGQDDVVERMMICILSRGHGLLMGVPGLAKTLLVNSLAQTSSLSFSRIQFTPDLMPSDITGTDILQIAGTDGRREFEFVKGPLFGNVILADEINRTPPKTQSALLEAMQEHRVTVAGRHYNLPEPFFVLATQNPIEQEGTYPLPEAQLDRFMFLITVNYPNREEELRISRETTAGVPPKLKKIINGKKLLEFQDLVERVPVPEHVHEMAVDLVRRTRPNSDESPAWLRKWVQWGAGPRAVQYLIRGAKARAVLHGRYLAGLDDFDAVAEPVLSHRILTNFQAQSEGVTSITVIERLLKELRKEKDAERA